MTWPAAAAARTDASPRGPAAGDPEGEAAAALARGDRDTALAVLMRAYGGPVYRYCLQMVGDRDLADEVHQTTFVQAYEGLARFGGRSLLRTWLFGIARHRCLDALKVARRRRVRFGDLAEAPERPMPGGSAEESLSGRSVARALEECLRQLAPRVREAMLLRYQQGLSYPAIARLSGERPPTLQARVARALPVLRRCAEEKGVAP